MVGMCARQAHLKEEAGDLEGVRHRENYQEVP